MFVDSGREEIKDMRLNANVEDENLSNRLFLRLIAKDKTFININFTYCIFDNAYMRGCSFQDCNFTGCKFVNSNMVGSSFSGCNFQYATFEKTQIDNDVLSSSCPDRENLKLKFARSLRLNYQQLGDAVSANKAMNVELDATRQHHLDAWRANDSYNRKKYSGWKRAVAFWDWFIFCLLDFIWGNGESLPKLLRIVVIALFLITVFEVHQSPNANSVISYWETFCSSPEILFGVIKPSYLSEDIQVGIYIFRLIMFAFFMSITIKRFNRR